MRVVLRGFAPPGATKVKEGLERARWWIGGLRCGRVVIARALEQALVLKGWMWEVGDGQLRSWEPVAQPKAGKRRRVTRLSQPSCKRR